jgi:hypothetical protein
MPTSKKGIAHIQPRIDPSFPEFGKYMIGRALFEATSLRLEGRIECSVPKWMDPLVSALEEYGFQRRMETIRMGIAL